MPKSTDKTRIIHPHTYLKSNKIGVGIYLDYASSANPECANPGAIHSLGVREKNKLENARKNVAAILQSQSSEVIFTSGSTESNNLAILGVLNAAKEKIPHFITTNIEHSSVLEIFKYLEEHKKAEVTFVEAEQNGMIDPEKIRKALKPNTVLVSVMYANGEIGTIEPLHAIGKVIRHYNKINSRKILFHTDATQAVNYLPIQVAKLGVDLMSFSSSKFYGPKGIGILYVKKNTPIRKIMFGGDHEFGLRPGTESVILALGLAEALTFTEKIKIKEVKRLVKLRDYFFTELHKIFSSEGPTPVVRGRAQDKKFHEAKFIINGDLKNRLPNNVNITIPNIPGDLLVIELSARGIMASAKSACKMGDEKASYVIKAIDKNIRETDGSIRFSLGRATTKRDIIYTVKVLSQILIKLKKWYTQHT
ncbi:hypothetical protein A3A05_03010 [Candidatus Nomurabacteria bacterium RIFCSPLOWO2_01_FULL_41_12]|uniref:Aminotransferase class V domain-containing protein n=1 Tax=Candidatus Nomurabacteria bacterium RIFCSPLOWO2_01_FULL_41_12 TaxID=1801774 RepID=A0A1F6WX98_9BACT|nr:MAG: hypothetical protein A2732_01430 [Candidatus Nomurabacteria bacterium RIFCSPHIGHO2_01_FULL_40_10]OGI86493.1 MAG: hypothetical protein A3A05_03010 [Candidatus Nomurabacteria bacterium RIFCSPLOWO2_01_FULL_41_12]